MLQGASATTVWVLGVAGVGSFVVLEIVANKIGAIGRKLFFLVFIVSLWVLGAALFVLLPTYLAWIAIVVLSIRAAYTALFRKESNNKDSADEQSYMAVRIGLIVVLALLAGGHMLSFLLKEVHDWPYRKVLAKLERIQWSNSTYSADWTDPGAGFLRDKVLLVDSEPGPLAGVPRFLRPPAARIASVCKFLPRYRVSVHQGEVPNELRATRAEEVGTIALLSEDLYSTRYYAEYYPGRTSSTPDPNVTGERRTLSVMLFDLASEKVVGERSFEEKSAERVSARRGTDAHFSADDPHADLPSYLRHLPRR